MDKIFSARLDEAVIRRIAALAQRLGTSKKAVVEGALRMYAESVDAHENVDVFDQTSGAWQRQESPSQTVKKARQAFLYRHEKACRVRAYFDADVVCKRAW